MPIMLRLDGNSWHSYTRGLKRPFDQNLIDAVNETAKMLCSKIPNVKIAYTQSDEISILIYSPDFDNESWFGGNIQKITSISAGMASSYFTSISDRVFGSIKPTQFDARVFVIPLDEVVNSFEFRQQDMTRNSVQMVARSLYSHSECNNKNCKQLQEMIFQKGINWNNLPTSQKRGRCVVKQSVIGTATNKHTGESKSFTRNTWVIDNEIPIFHEDRNYIEKHLTQAD
jgi:tRNA(His) 5'-end guanylyltransferase